MRTKSALGTLEEYRVGKERKFSPRIANPMPESKTDLEKEKRTDVKQNS